MMSGLAAKLPADWRQNLTALALIVFFAVFNLFSLRNLSLTADEGRHYRYGMNILNLDSDRLVYKSGAVDDSKMPVSALNALPAKISEFVPVGRLKDGLNSFLMARLVTVLFSALVAWLVFRWSAALFGLVPGLISLGLYVLDPNIMAHSELVTTDIYAAGMTLFCAYWLWKFAEHRKPTDGLVFLGVLGLGLLAKYTSVVLFPLSALALAVHDWLSSGADKGDRPRNTGRYLGKFSLYALAALLACLAAVNIGYLFNRSFTPLGDYEFESRVFQQVQARFSWLERLPVPTPYPYLQGLDLVTYRENTGVGYGRIYLLGRLHEGVGFAGYYLIASLFKVPIAIQIVLLASLVVYFSDRNRRSTLWRDQIFLLLPAAFFAVYFNFFYNAQLGIRFYLIEFPLLYVFAGTLFQDWRKFSPALRTASFMLGAYLLASVLSYYPHYLSYFNELVWDRRDAYKYLADSNIDWGQDKYYLDQYRADHAEVVYEPKKIKAGRIVVSVNDLVGVTADPGQFAWLRENYEPAETVAYSYLVYLVSQEDLNHLCETKSICQSP
jgi:dolichyl-phosphate-mannose-protein mannosyltransferase